MSKLDYAVCLGKWAQNNGFTIVQAAEIVRLARRCGKLNTHSTNGDWHRRVNSPDEKTESSEEWDKDLDRLTERLSGLVSPGFTVRYDSLCPCLVRKGDEHTGQTVQIPLP